MEKIRLLIHAGAGTISESPQHASLIQQHLRTLNEIVASNYQQLRDGCSALEVVEQCVMAMENYPGFNAGRGAVLNSEGKAELDAAIMDGKSLNAGAVAAVQRIKNPISGARAVLSYSPHVLLAGPHADQFCEANNITMVEPSYFITEPRLQQLARAQTQGHAQDIDALGTVGAVALDSEGNLAAATSTGGKANKIPGRVGDSPIIGAGTWADNNTCAVSGTGDGEIFIRAAFAHEVHCLIQYANLDLATACRQALMKISTLDGEGGCIAIDADGNYVIEFNTTGMFRAWVDEKEQIHAQVYR